MKLSEYLDERGIPIAAFARKLGISAATIHHILKENRDLRLSVAVRIEEATKGSVVCRELLPNRFLEIQNRKASGSSKKHLTKKKVV